MALHLAALPLCRAQPRYCSRTGVVKPPHAVLAGSSWPTVSGGGRSRRPAAPPAAAGPEAAGWGPDQQQQQQQPTTSWDVAASSSDDIDVDLFPPELEEGFDPEFAVENVLALILIALIALAAGNVLLKLIIVAYSLISAGVRYTVIGMLLLVGLLVFQPGRWWF